MGIAVFGGTFDPVHLGHLLIAEEAYNSFSLKKIIFMPAGQPLIKQLLRLVPLIIAGRC